MNTKVSMAGKLYAGHVPVHGAPEKVASQVCYRTNNVSVSKRQRWSISSQSGVMASCQSGRMAIKRASTPTKNCVQAANVSNVAQIGQTNRPKIS